MSRFEIKMPKLGESITEGTIISWSVQVGGGCVKTLAQPFSIIYSPVIFSFVYAAFFSFIW